MPTTLLIIYRILGAALFALAAAAIVEKYRTVRGETNDSFWFKHDKTVGKAIQVWYNPNARCVERKSWETEIFSAVLAVIGAALLLIR